MDDFNMGGAPRGPRQLFDVSSLGLKCADCETEIKELPFQPNQDRPVYCRDCNSKRRPARPRF